MILEHLDSVFGRVHVIVVRLDQQEVAIVCSKDFFDLIINELRTNMTEAFDQIKQDPGFDKWLDKWQHLLQFPQIRDFLKINQDIKQPTRQQYEQVLEFIGQHPKTVAD